MIGGVEAGKAIDATLHRPSPILRPRQRSDRTGRNIAKHVGGACDDAEELAIQGEGVVAQAGEDLDVALN